MLLRFNCKNLFCNAGSITVNEYDVANLDEYIKNAKCRVCGYVGFMPIHHILKADEIILQILKKQKTHLWKDLFKQINYDKMPNNLDQQNIDSVMRFDIDIIATGDL